MGLLIHSSDQTLVRQAGAGRRRGVVFPPPFLPSLLLSTYVDASLILSTDLTLKPGLMGTDAHSQGFPGCGENHTYAENATL